MWSFFLMIFGMAFPICDCEYNKVRTRRHSMFKIQVWGRYADGFLFFLKGYNTGVDFLINFNCHDGTFGLLTWRTVDVS